MRFARLLPAAILVLASAGSALAATCADDIATIERRLDSAGAERVTGKEPVGGATSSGSDKALDKPPAVKPSDPDTKSSAAGVKEARDLIERARAQDKAGDAKGCQDTMTRAKEKAGALP